MTSIYSAVIKKIDPSSNEEYELSHVPIESRKGIVQMAIVFVGYTFTPSTLVYGGAWAGNLKLTDFVISQGIGFAFAALLSTTVGLLL
jgi:purine-cytosine permease-like protein